MVTLSLEIPHRFVNRFLLVVICDLAININRSSIRGLKEPKHQRCIVLYSKVAGIIGPFLLGPIIGLLIFFFNKKTCTGYV